MRTSTYQQKAQGDLTGRKGRVRIDDIFSAGGGLGHARHRRRGAASGEGRWCIGSGLGMQRQKSGVR